MTPIMRTVGPWVFAAQHCLERVNAGQSQLEDMNTWWLRHVSHADRAKRAYYKQADGMDPAQPGPPAAQAATHTGWVAACGAICDEMERQRDLADVLTADHRAAEARLQSEAQQAEAAVAVTPDGEAGEVAAAAEAARAEDLAAQAAEQAELARLAATWSETAGAAARFGHDMVTEYDRKYAPVNAAYRRAGGDAADAREYGA